MEKQEIVKIAKLLFDARLGARPIEQLSNQFEKFTIPEAYSIQEEGIKLRQGQGENIIGLKMGLTSEAKRKQMNLDSPLYGVLTDKMQLQDGSTFSISGAHGIHPKIEPEIAFYISKDLRGPVNEKQVLEACSGVCAGLEILDSRYTQFKYFSMEDVISDNSSSYYFVLGSKIKPPQDLDLINLKMEMKVNGQVVQSGTSKAISDNPVVSVIQLCELLSTRGQYLKAGSLVLAGAATPAVALEPGMTVTLEVSHLEKVTIKIVK